MPYQRRIQMFANIVRSPEPTPDDMFEAREVKGGLLPQPSSVNRGADSIDPARAVACPLGPSDCHPCSFRGFGFPTGVF
jgi:hypothetical protein